MPHKLFKQGLFSISAIMQGLRLYPAEHPQIQRQLDNTMANLQPLLDQHSKITIGLLDGTLLLNDIPCLEQQPALQELKKLLERHQLQAIDILPGVDQRQLLCLCQLLPKDSTINLTEQLKSADVQAIQAILLEKKPESPRAVHQQALEVIEDLSNDIRNGRIPSSDNAIKAVKDMVSTILDEPFALLAMSMLKDYDNYTFNHSVNVAVIALTVGRACGLSKPDLHKLGMGSLLHDVGKLTIDHEIISKPGKLSNDEIKVMQQHPVNGARIVAEMEQMSEEVVDIVNGHHLRFDRTGYPADSRGRTMSALADIACIADIYDAMTTIRCYQRPCSPRQALKKMIAMSGSLLHPEYLQKFLDYLGPYPVGTLVRLKDGSIGLIIDQNHRQPGSLLLNVIFSSDGKKLKEPQHLELADNSEIVADVDPMLKGISPEDYLLE